ncbi:TetR family transcriptional regulator [Pigmentiphaga litoralis]|nr:TetR/AcrR family transcriptional regulator [Pigmentiphaga litoralis]GGX05278.1 TetR family transcriptional regulator [Pigmentiphaga litoralis]
MHDMTPRHPDPSPALDPLDRLLETTESLVYRDGIHATGIDAIVKASGASRKTVYAHFGSKDVLVVAALRARHNRWLHWFRTRTLAAGNDAASRLLGMFTVLESWFVDPGYHGCAFLNAAGEIGDATSAIRMLAREHKADLLAFIHETASGLDASDAARAALARQWLILIDGAIAVALVSGNATAAQDAQAAGAALLAAQGATGTPSPPLSPTH